MKNQVIALSLRETTSYTVLSLNDFLFMMSSLAEEIASNEDASKVYDQLLIQSEELDDGVAIVTKLKERVQFIAKRAMQKGVLSGALEGAAETATNGPRRITNGLEISKAKTKRLLRKAS